MNIDKTESEWESELTPEEYHVLREKGTEPAFTGEYDENFDKGSYECRACGTKIFESGTKFHSGSGWPSFYDAIPGTVVLTPDDTLGMHRTEITCATCGSHLGHLFQGENFGNPIDNRYCVNSLSLKFDPNS